MHWAEVRTLYPDQFVLLQMLQSHYKGNVLCVDEVAIIRPIADSHDALRELRNAHNERFIYHTSQAEIALEIRPRAGIRGGGWNEKLSSS